MSIKTIDKQIKGDAGLAKKINKGAERMVFDILQSTQYSTPIKSTIRELTTNACDAQREKEMAAEILTGKTEASEYYIERYGEQYSDSNFDPEYYNLDHLDLSTNSVTIIYNENEGTGYCDEISISDKGVGIGKRRLEGVLELGYSTKRNTSQNFGAFGLGAKVALSTGVDFYTIETVYNGKKFKMNCYNYKTDFLVSPFNVETKAPNGHVTLSDGTKVHYEHSDMKNGTTISFKVKRHNRRAYSDAVREQLMYMDNVDFYINEEDEYERKTYFKPEILHNSDSLIISDTNVFSRPHIVLTKDVGAATGVNYGFVDFRELEMETMFGSVAFKCPARQVIVDTDTGIEKIIQEGVDVTPSREKVIWNENTKDYIKGVIKEAAVEATSIVEESLSKEKDFVSWLLACRAVFTKADSSSVLGRLSNIIDKDSVKPVFSEDAKIKAESVKILFQGLSIRSISIEKNIKKKEFTVKREEISNYSLFKENNLFWMGDSHHSKIKDAYLKYICEDGPVLCIDTINLDNDLPGLEAIKSKRDTVISFFKDSEHVRSYESIEVPEDWKDEYYGNLDKLDNKNISKISPEDRRFLENKMVAYTFRINSKKRHSSGSDDWFVRDKVEPKIKDVIQSDRITYYGTSEDDLKLMAACAVLQPFAPELSELSDSIPYYYKNSEDRCFYFDCIPTRIYWQDSETGWDADNIDIPQILRVAQNKVKLITKNPKVRHIDEFFLQLTPDGGYTMDPYAVKYNTIRIASDASTKNHLRILERSNPELYLKYVAVWENSNVLGTHILKDMSEETIKYLDKLSDAQKFLHQSKDEALRKAYVKDKFVVDVPEIIAYDQELFNYNEELLEWNKDVGALLRGLSLFYNITPKHGVKWNEDQLKEIFIYLESRGRLDWKS